MADEQLEAVLNGNDVNLPAQEEFKPCDEQLEACGDNRNDVNLATQEEIKPYDNPLCKKFLHAAMAGDWDAASVLLKEDENLARAKVTSGGETVLHIVAAVAEEKHVYFVEKLLDYMNTDDLEITNSRGSTALHLAAIAGNVEIARLLVSKNRKLPTIAAGMTPLYLAVLTRHNDMVEYLLQFSEFKPHHTAVDGSPILSTCISSGLYGIALQLVKKYEFLAVAMEDDGEGPLHALARNPSAFVVENGGQRFWQRVNLTKFWKKVPKNEMSSESNVSQLLNQIWHAVEGQRDVENSKTEDNVSLLFIAAWAGNYEFLVDLLRRYPDLLYKHDDSDHSIFHIAVLNRYESIFSLIYEIGGLKDLIASYRENNNTTMLHLAARLAPPGQLEILPGAALQMQRELLWYKAVEKIVPPSYIKMKDANEETPHDLFIEEHEELMKKGEKWMKQTAHSCMVVATLIATVVFTTAFTIPGGNDDKSGMPILLSDKFFVAFMISEILAMLSASTSIIMFLCILTSRYGEEDFLESLPFWLLTGITTLFVSIAAMMVAFCTTFLLFHRRGLSNVPTLLLGLFSLVPIMFLWFKYPLLVDILSSTYGSSSLFKSRGRLFSSRISI